MVLDLSRTRGRFGLGPLLLALVVCLSTCAAPVDEALPQLKAEPETVVAPTVTALAPESLVATARGHVSTLVAYDGPNGSPIELPFQVPNPHQFGSPMTLMVTEGQPGDAWIKVQLPIRPNAQEGWVEGKDFHLSATDIRAEVDLSDTSVVVYQGHKVIAETKAVVGSSITPTPLGTFYVTAKKENTEQYLGPWALALSSFSEVHETFGGGLPVIAIHGTNHPDQVGQSRSNGCIRIPNEIVTFLAETVPLGAPVAISL